MIEKYLFYFLAGVTILTAIGVVSARNIFRAALFLGASLLSIAALYLLMGSEFLAAVQVLIYVGGILTLILFAVMLTKKISDTSIRQASERKAPAFLVSLAILGIMVYGILSTPLESVVGSPRIADTEAVGKALFVQNILPFEVASVLLLIALVGAITLARRDDKK